MLDFKAYTGNTMGEYLAKCRLRNAIELLLQKNTIEYVAEKCGFADNSGFIRSFKRHYGTTPYKYIKNLR
jgi:AraC family chitin signaling transcriptional activator